MALIVCIECRRDVSDKAKTCPHCGAPIAAGTSRLRPAAPGSAKGTVAFRVARIVAVVVVLGAAYGVWQAMTSDRKAPFSAGLTAAFREPRTIADERVALKAGRPASYAFALDTDSRVHVRVTALADPVDIMLMPKAEAERFRRAAGALFGGAYSGFPAFSSSRVGLMDKTEVVPKGEWTFVVVRPEGASAGTAETPAEIAVTVY